MSEKRRSVFTTLLLRIIIIVFLFFIVMAGFQIYETINIQKENQKILEIKNRDVIDGLINSWDAILKSMDKIFNVTLENASLKIHEIDSAHDLKTVNLLKQMQLYHMDKTCFNFQIIKDSVIINATRKSDKGMNIKSLETNTEKILTEINKEKGFIKRNLDIDTITQRFRCTGYLLTKDKKYIVRIDCFSEAADELMVLFASQMKRIKKENENILSINQYFGSEHHYMGLISDTVIYELQDSLIKKVFIDKTPFSKQFSKDKKKMTTDFVFHDPENLQWDSVCSVFYITTSAADHKIIVFEIIKKQIIVLFFFLLLLFVIYLLTTRKLKITLKDLRLKTTMITDGKMNERLIVKGQCESAILAEQFNTMVEKLETSQNELKKKNDEIEKNLKTLHDQKEEIESQRDEIEAQRDDLEAQRDLVMKQNETILEQKKSITDSILYASRIQSAILPPNDVVKYLLPKHFILFIPKDIVSGDFYWLTHRHGEIIVAVADCTGHGVPGAFMSVLGSTLLKDVVNNSKTLQANIILNDLRDQILLSLRQTGQTGETKDGMDISLCIINPEKMKLQFASAYQPLYLIREGQLKEIKADRMPIGISSKAGKPFTNHELEIIKNDSIYLFSDGYTDQFGGEKGKKFKSPQFKELLLEIQDNIMYDQGEILKQKIEEWMGLTELYEKYEQVDDITVMGIKI